MTDQTNPFLSDWDTPFGCPPFSDIKTEHYLPAFEFAFKQHLEEIDVIIECNEEPDFTNTIEAFEITGNLLHRIAHVFFNMTSSSTDDELQKVETTIMPMWAAHHSEILTRRDLFQRVDEVFESLSSLSLTSEQRRLTEETHKRFIRAGAALDEQARRTVKQLDEELSGLCTAFGQNVLNDTNNFELVIENQSDLKGLSASIRSSAAQEAIERGHDGKYVFTISRSSITAFLQFSERRELREKIFKAYSKCGDNGNEHDNNRLVSQIASARAKRANILGFESHAHYMLDDRMAKTPEAVRKLLDQLWTPAKNKVRQEAADLQARIQSEGGNFTLAPWDWWYYTEKVRSDRFDFDEEALKPYFQLENVRDGAFQVAKKLYGITFKPLHGVPTYHEDVQVYEVVDGDSSIGHFLVDYHMRPSKRGGAWMSAFREQSKIKGEIRPIIVNVCNFPKGTGDMPCLLGLDEVRTLFHEFGHALHGLLTQCTYESLSGTNVKQDFVELPSQIMEHWATEPEVMKTFARHYQTGETIPDELIAKIQKAHTFNQGFATTEYLAASFLDLDWHELSSGIDPASPPFEVKSFEDRSMQSIELIAEVAPRYRSTYFQHIFSGDSYSAGYYSYIWAEVLDADGFEAFKENGIFDQNTARLFRQQILEKGGTDDPMTLYRKFRGRDPDVRPLLKHRGLESAG